jgi:hypothetical protein
MADSNKQYNRKEFLTFLGKASGGSYYGSIDRKDEPTQPARIGHSVLSWG